MVSSHFSGGVAQQLLLVPGLMCDCAVWEPMLATLQQHAVCRIVDHGDADSLEQMAATLLRDAPERFALAGHSMGGRVAMEVLRRAPHRVSRIALMDTGYRARPIGAAGQAEEHKRYALLELAQSQGVRAMAAQWVEGMVAPARLPDAQLIGQIVDMFARKSAAVFAVQVRALLQREDATPVLRTVRVPALVLCGREDAWSPVSQHQEIADLLPARPAVCVVEGAGHMVTMEQPEAVAGALVAWLQQEPAHALAHST